MEEVLRWLDAEKRRALGQLPPAEFERLGKAWGLPSSRHFSGIPANFPVIQLSVLYPRLIRVDTCSHLPYIFEGDCYGKAAKRRAVAESLRLYRHLAIGRARFRGVRPGQSEN